MSNYYKEHYKEFIDTTINCDMSNIYHFFEQYLNKDATTILDVGFGSGRDSLYFSNNYEVYSIDTEELFCEHAKEIGLKHIENASVLEMEYMNKFDGIWACASLLHLTSEELHIALNKCFGALKDNGIMYCSFKYGEFEGIRNDRYYLDINYEKFVEFIKNTKFKILDFIITQDVRKDREEKWLNIIIKK